jgi:V8-like Glu-specific endopeptidase
MAASYSTTSYPYDCVCFIVATLPDGQSYQGSGVIIGPHTVLTASHLLWDASVNEGASAITVFPGYNQGGTPIAGQWAEHYNTIDDSGGKETEATSQNDFAIIDFSTDLTPYGSFGVGVNYTGGLVNMTGYPGNLNGVQTQQAGSVSANALYAALDYGTLTTSPGDSGGPLWINEGTAANPEPVVVGLVSTSDWGIRLTSADLSTIDSWVTSDSYLWGGSGTQLAANASLASLSGGSGDDTLVSPNANGPDTVFGGAGQDSIVGGQGFDQINGNTGDDTIVGRSATGDWLLGGQGQDSIDASASHGDNILNGNLGNDTLIGGAGADTLRGGQGDDVIHAGPGRAWISGDLGANTIFGGQGLDTLHAGPGHDVVNGWHAGDLVLVDAGVTFSVAQVGGDVHVLFSNGGEMDLIGVQQSSLQSGWIYTV